MNYNVKTTHFFDSEVKRIAKRHKGIKTDLENLIADLKVNPMMGTDLGQHIYKIRIAVSGTNKGKSGGARVITYVAVRSETVFLSAIYLKSEHNTVNVGSIVELLKSEGLL